MYSIRQLSNITGLTTRTLRNYIKAGMLRGDKVNGVWEFSEEQVNDFISHPSVKSSIQAKNNSIVYDFMTEYNCTENEMCILLNLTISHDEAQKTADFFFAAANQSEHIRFSYSYEKQKAHFILKGAESEIQELMHKYYQR